MRACQDGSLPHASTELLSEAVSFSDKCRRTNDNAACRSTETLHTCCRSHSGANAAARTTYKRWRDKRLSSVGHSIDHACVDACRDVFKSAGAALEAVICGHLGQAERGSGDRVHDGLYRDPCTHSIRRVKHTQHAAYDK